MLIFILLVVLVLFSGCAPTQKVSPEYQAQLEKRHHIVRFEADVEFDGQPLVFDELVECSAVIRPRRTGKAPVSAVYENRRWMTQRLADGGSVSATVHPFYCNEFAYLWDEKVPKREAVNTLHLPLFEYRNDTKAPTRIEMYVSEDYYEKSYARLKINDIRITPATYPPTEADITKARQQAKRDRFRYGRAKDDGWEESRVIPVEDTIWKRDPRLVEYFNEFQSERNFVQLDLDRQADQASDPKKNARFRIGKMTGRNGADLSPLVGGVPRVALAAPGALPRLHPDDYPKGRIGYWAGDVIPIDRDRNGNCFANTAKTGFVILHYQPIGRIDMCDSFVLDDRPIPYGSKNNFRFFYDPITRRGYRVSQSNGIFFL